MEFKKSVEQKIASILGRNGMSIGELLTKRFKLSK
jgi:hypothetical protein